MLSEWKKTGVGCYAREDGAEIICEGSGRWTAYPPNPQASPFGPYPTLADAKAALGQPSSHPDTREGTNG